MSSGLLQKMTEPKQTTRWGVIITNLGTPQALTKSAYRAFLKEFLSDRRVVEIPRLVWWPILNLFILPRRPKSLIKAYQKIWIESEGSPLAVTTQKQAHALLSELSQRLGHDCPVIKYAMTYGAPKLEQQVKTMRDDGVDRIVVIPLNPQYSASTTGPIYDQYAQLIKKSRNIPDIVIHQSYFRRNDYIEALASSVNEFRQKNGSAEKLLMSFHGIPQRNVALGDPYADQCAVTAKLLAQSLNLDSEQWSMSYQSRFGAAKWLQPYTLGVLERWAQDGVKSVQIVCPGFTADCLETLEEIAVEAKEYFIQSGGESLDLIPCLNDRKAHIQMLANIAQEYVSPR